MPKRRRPEFIPADPADENVKLPRQLRVNIEHVAARAEGRPPRPVAIDVVNITNAQIDGVLERLAQGELRVSDRDPGIAIALLREGARRIKADRQKAQDPKVQAAQKVRDAAIKKRLKLVFEAVLELPSNRLRHLNGKKTVERLARVVTKRLGPKVTEATIRHDIRVLRPYLWAAQKGRIKTVEWEPAEREQLRNATMAIMAMRVRFEHTVFRFNKALKQLNPK